MPDSTIEMIKDALIQACVAGDAATVEKLLVEADEFAKEPVDGDEQTSSSPSSKIRSLLFQESVKWNDKDGKEITTPIVFIPIDYGYVNIVDLLLQKAVATSDDSTQQPSSGGFDLNTVQDENGYTLLQWASFSGHIDIVKLLIGDNGENGGGVPKVKPDSEATDLAKEYKHTEIAKLLFEYGRDSMYAGIAPDDVHAIMLKACRVGDIVTVQKLLDEGYEYDHWRQPIGTSNKENQNDGEGGDGDGENTEYQEYTPAWIALRCGHIDIIHAFQESGIRLDELQQGTEDGAAAVEAAASATAVASDVVNQSIPEEEEEGGGHVENDGDNANAVETQNEER